MLTAIICCSAGVSVQHFDFSESCKEEPCSSSWKGEKKNKLSAWLHPISCFLWSRFTGSHWVVGWLSSPLPMDCLGNQILHYVVWYFTHTHKYRAKSSCVGLACGTQHPSPWGFNLERWWLWWPTSLFSIYFSLVLPLSLNDSVSINV